MNEELGSRTTLHFTAHYDGPKFVKQNKGLSCYQTLKLSKLAFQHAQTTLKKKIALQRLHCIAEERPNRVSITFLMQPPRNYKWRSLSRAFPRTDNSSKNIQYHHIAGMKIVEVLHPI